MKWNSTLKFTEENIKEALTFYIMANKDKFGDDIKIESINIHVNSRLVGYHQNEHYETFFDGIDVQISMEK